MNDDEYETSLGRKMTARERFERKQLKREKSALEEEDHAEEVSFQDNYIYAKFLLFTVVFLGIGWQAHTRLVKRWKM